MSRTYTELAIRIKDELVDIDRSVEKALKSWLPDLWPKLRDELQAFGNFLKELALENDK